LNMCRIQRYNFCLCCLFMWVSFFATYKDFHVALYTTYRARSNRNVAVYLQLSKHRI
jgi:hypothetical protein